MRLLLIALLISCASSAQITLNNADFADGGDTVRMSNATDPNIDFLSTGANSTWDFSGLVAESQVLKSYSTLSGTSTFMQLLFGPFAPTRYQATNFVAATALPIDQLGGMLPINISEINAVSRNTNDSITSIGISMVVEGNELPFRSDTIETRYKFPLNYGNSYTSRGYTNIDLNPIYDGIWIQYRQRSSAVDGWGSITTPFGAFDALRIKHEITEQDSIYVGQLGFWLSLPIPQSNIYEWWANGELEPVLRITTSMGGGNENVTAIEYRDLYDPLIAGINESTLAFSVYPNPTQEQLVLEGAEIGATYLVVSTDGKVVLSGEIASNSSVIDVSMLEFGAYAVIVRNSNGVFGSTTFVKQ